MTLHRAGCLIWCGQCPAGICRQTQPSTVPTAADYVEDGIDSTSAARWKTQAIREAQRARDNYAHIIILEQTIADLEHRNTILETGMTDALTLAAALTAPDLVELGRQLASARDDLITRGIDPADLAIPDSPDPTAVDIPPTPRGP